MASPVMVRSSSPADGATVLSSIVAELNRGFEQVSSATVARHADAISDSEQSLKNAKAACDTVNSLLAELPPQRAPELQMRLDALRSIVFDLSNGLLA